MREIEESEALLVQQMDRGCKSSWNWSWLKLETTIKVHAVKHTFILSDFFKKIEKKGCAKCTLCMKEINYRDVIDAKRSNMKISTFDAVQTVKYVLRSMGKSGIGMFKRDDINMGPIDKTLSRNIRAAGRRDKTDREKRMEAKQKRQAEYGCSATCESAEKAKTTALAKERQTRLKHVKKMIAVRRKALDTLQEVARKKRKEV